LPSALPERPKHDLGLPDELWSGVDCRWGQRGGMNRIGMLGGMSWESTALYYRLVNELVRDRLGGLASAVLIAAWTSPSSESSRSRTGGTTRRSCCWRRHRPWRPSARNWWCWAPTTCTRSHPRHPRPGHLHPRRRGNPALLLRCSAAPSWSFSAPPRTAPRRCCPPPGLHIHAAIDAALARVGRAARSARAPVVTVGFLAARWGPPSIWPRRIHARAASGNGPAGAGATGQGGVVPDLGVLHRQKGIHLRSASK
jgi:hypothetical protein